MVSDLQLDPPDSQLLYWKGGSICFLNEFVWGYNAFDIILTHHYRALEVVWWDVVGVKVGVWLVVGWGAGCGVVK